MRTAILIGILALPALARAEGGVDIGNGGGVIACPDAGGKTRYQAADAYRVREGEWDLDLQLPAPREDFEPPIPAAGATRDAWDIALQILDRVRPFDPTRAALYRVHAQSFFSEAKLIRDKEFFPTLDYTGFFLRKRCQYVTVVNQRERVYPKGKRYYINEPVWSQLGVEDRALLISHEIIYRVALEAGVAPDSDGVSYFNAYLASGPDTGDEDSGTYSETLIASGLEQVRGFAFETVVKTWTAVDPVIKAHPSFVVTTTESFDSRAAGGVRSVKGTWIQFEGDERNATFRIPITGQTALLANSRVSPGLFCLDLSDEKFSYSGSTLHVRGGGDSPFPTGSEACLDSFGRLRSLELGRARNRTGIWWARIEFPGSVVGRQYFLAPGARAAWAESGEIETIHGSLVEVDFEHGSMKDPRIETILAPSVGGTLSCNISRYTLHFENGLAVSCQ